MGKRLGIIAGDGKFPVLLAEEINKNGYISVIVAHTGLTPQYIEKTADKTFWIKVGQLSKLIEIFKSEGITEAIMAGGISKRFMFSDMKPDLRALSLLIRLKDRKDDTILRAIAGELEKEGITVNKATTYIESILAEKETLTKRKLSRDEKKDIDFGFDIAKAIGRLDIGQCVIVKDRAVLAVEAIEGTNEAIRRGGALSNGGAVVVKVCKPGQDLRFDLPAVGPDTISCMKEVNAVVLAVESGMTVMIDKDSMIKSADEAGITIVGI